MIISSRLTPMLPTQTTTTAETAPQQPAAVDVGQVAAPLANAEIELQRANSETPPSTQPDENSTETAAGGVLSGPRPEIEVNRWNLPLLMPRYITERERPFSMGDIADNLSQLPNQGERERRIGLEDVVTAFNDRLPGVTERDEVVPFGREDYISGVEGGIQPHETHPDFATTLYVKGGSDPDEVDMNDVDQGGIGDCFLLASIAAVARQHPEIIKNMIRDNGDGTYTVTFKERGAYPGDGWPQQYIDRPITVSAEFEQGLLGNQHALPGDVSAGVREIWPLVIEKAYMQWVDATNVKNGGDPAVVLEALTGRAVTTHGDAFKEMDQQGISNPIYLGGIHVDFAELKADLDSGEAIVFSTPKMPDGFEFPYGLVQSHAYAVKNMWTDADGRQWVRLHNPWGPSDLHPIVPFDQIDNLFRRVSTTGENTKSLFG